MQCISSPYGRFFVLREITVRVSCSDADKANCVPVACAFELWGGRKKKCIMQQWSLWDSMQQNTRVSWVQRKWSIIKMKMLPRNLIYTRMSWSMSPWCLVLGQANVTPFLGGEMLLRLLDAFLLPQEMYYKDMQLKQWMKRFKKTFSGGKGLFQVRYIFMGSILQCK